MSLLMGEDRSRQRWAARQKGNIRIGATIGVRGVVPQRNYVDPATIEWFFPVRRKVRLATEVQPW